MHGGKRAKAGRKPGSKGRLKKEVAAAAESKLDDILKGRDCPLEHMLKVMSDAMKDDSLRLEAAKAAAPYVHKKQPQDVNHGGGIAMTGVDFFIVGESEA